MVQPKSIKKISGSELRIIWRDEHESVFRLDLLRDLCPCAGCKGESVLLHHYEAPATDPSTPGRNELVSAIPVGSYALQLQWADGHNTGMYTWEYLRENCPCQECAPANHKG